jgi:hypothetical protein
MSLCVEESRMRWKHSIISLSALAIRRRYTAGEVENLICKIGGRNDVEIRKSNIFNNFQFAAQMVYGGSGGVAFRCKNNPIPSFILFARLSGARPKHIWQQISNQV